MPEKESSFYMWMALVVVVIGTFMAILDTSIVNIAIPKMMAVFNVSTDKIQWVLTGYMLTMGTVIPLTGYLSDNFGAKKVYIWAMITFTAGSALCGLAWSNSSMVAARVIQAAGGGVIMPVSMAILYQVIPMEKRGMALGIWGISAMAAPAIGPTLSGYIVENLDWRLIFTINIPVGVVGVIMAALLLKESPKKPVKSFDWIGFITVAAGLVSILYVLGEGSNVDWNDPETVGLLGLGIFSLVIFVINEMFHNEPLLDLRLFKILPFTLSIIVSSITNIALFGGIFLIPLFLQNLQGHTAMQSGILLFPSAVATGIVMPIAGKLFDKFGPKPVVVPGILLITLGTYGLSRITLDTPGSTIVWLTVIRGIGLGLSMMPSSTAGMNAVPQHMVARASALSNVMRQIAGSLGIAVLTTVLQHQQSVIYVRLAEQVSWFDQGSMYLMKLVQNLFTQNGISAGEAQGMATGTIYGQVAKQAFLLAINDTLLVTVFISLCAVPITMFLQNKKHPKGEGPVHVMAE